VGRCELYLGNCLEKLKELPDECVDCVLTDPPYNISQDGKQINRTNLKFGVYKRDTSIKLDFGEWDKMPEDEYLSFTEQWFAEVTRIMKEKAWIYIFFDKQRTGYFDLFLAKKYSIKPKAIIVWCKTNPTPRFRKANWTSATEFIWAGVKGKAGLKNFGRQNEMRSYFLYPNKSSYGETSHPTEKPIALCEYLIKPSTFEGDVVLDPFMGSGTTGIACMKLDRNFIGIEKDRGYFEIAKARIKPYLEQTRLISKKKQKWSVICDE